MYWEENTGDTETMFEQIDEVMKYWGYKQIIRYISRLKDNEVMRFWDIEVLR